MATFTNQAVQLPQYRPTQWDSSLISGLPFEIKAQVFRYLYGKGVPALRLVSKASAEAGASSLFKDGLTLRPHHDMSRLRMVCQNSELPNLQPNYQLPFQLI